MIHIVSFIVFAYLGVAWKKNTGINLSLKLLNLGLAGWHLFEILRLSGYIIKA
jgi:hypothetical protein